MNRNMKPLITAIIILVVLLVIPAILAPILHRPHVEVYADYGGKESDWISFWGNYLGAVVTGCISYFILWITIKSNKEENQQILKANKEENSRLIIKNQQENTRLMNANRELEEYKRKQDNYLRFRNEVSTRLANIDLSKYVGVFFDEHTVSSEALRRLEAFHQQLIQDYNSFVVLYDGECEAFLEEYKKAVDVLTEKVHDFIILFKNRETYKNNPQHAADVENKIKVEIGKLSQLKPVIENLWKSAKKEIEALKVIQ